MPLARILVRAEHDFRAPVKNKDNLRNYGLSFTL